MGCHKNITKERFPKQGENLNKEVEVCFHYDMSKCLTGIIVRDDMESPWIGIIQLEDGRYILTSECQYSIMR